MTDADKQQDGEWVWVPDEVECYRAAKVTSRSGGVTVQYENGETNNIPTKVKLEPLKWQHLQRITPDLVLLDVMSDPLILYNLKKRFLDDKIYTSIGTILISVNPYKFFDIYDKGTIHDYNEKLSEFKDMPPHVFVIAHHALQGITFRDGLSQSIIISGESGAGKTEATKQCLSYISTVAGSVSNVETKILQSNPILEGFGNAKTVRNNNSSRFGKYQEIFFNNDYALNGGRTTNYLLEKIRVVQQGPDERSFHIFYQLTEGLQDQQLRSKLGLKSANQHHYLSQSGCTTADGIDDRKEFADTKVAFGQLGFLPPEQQSLFETVAAVLHLGDIDFNVAGDKQCTIKPGGGLDHACRLLKIDSKDMTRALLIRVVKIRGQNDIDVSLSKKEATDNRDALAKFTYSAIFDWIVLKINKTLAAPSSSLKKTIGILDIFGFEIFKVNSFEQLCINFTNEKLQQHFNYNTFKLEEQTYQKEGIDFKHVEFIDNQPILDIIEKKPSGVLRMLDEELVIPKGSDAGFLEKTKQQHKNNKIYKNDVKMGRTTFSLEHFAGTVVYETDGFLEKNRDTLSQDLIDLLQKANNPFIKIIFPTLGDAGSKRKESLGKQFTNHLDVLMINLNKTQPHYIRCVKPNTMKAPMQFDTKMCQDQLRYSGVFEAVKIRKSGYPFRLKHNAFMERYGGAAGMGTSGGSSQCVAVAGKFKLNMKNVQVGHTQIFYRSDEHRTLELYRSIYVEKQKMDETLTELMKHDPKKMPKDEAERFFRKFAHTVYRCDELKIHSPVSEAARKRLDAFIETRMDPECEKLLKGGISAVDEDTLNRALKMAKERTYNNSLVKKARALRDKIVVLNAACQEAIGAVVEDMLRAATQNAQSIGLQSEIAKRCALLLRQVEEIEAEEKQVSPTLDPDRMTAVINKADEIGLNSPTIIACREMRDRVLQYNQECRDAIAAVVEDMLRAATQNCQSINLQSQDALACADLLAQVEAIEAEEKQATPSLDRNYMSQVIDSADAIRLNSPTIIHCRQLRNRIDRIYEESELATNTLVEDHMRVTLDAADRIGLTTEQCENFRRLIGLGTDQFIKEQLEAARRNKDVPRIIWLEISLKDWFFAQHGATFAFNRFDKLKLPEYWASEKILSLHKKELAAGYLSYQLEPIHSALTEIPRTATKKQRHFSKDACLMFKKLQVYMGDRELLKECGSQVDHLYQAVAHACNEQPLRDELYCQIIKQITNNPQASSKAKGFEAMLICLASFTPDDDFESYLEVWLRANAPDPKDRYIVALHRKIFSKTSGGGGLNSPAPPGEFSNIISNMDAEGYTEPKPDHPSWADLQQAYTEFGDTGGASAAGPASGGCGGGGRGRGRGGPQMPARGGGAARGRGGPQMPARGRGGPQMPARGRGGPQMPARGRGGPQMPTRGRGGPQMPARGRGW